MLASVIIHSDAKREFDVSSSLTGLGHLPGYLKVSVLSPTKDIFFSFCYIGSVTLVFFLFYTYENSNLCLSFLSSFSPMTRYTRQIKPNTDVVFLSMVTASSLYMATYDVLFHIIQLYDVATCYFYFSFLIIS